MNTTTMPKMRPVKSTNVGQVGYDERGLHVTLNSDDPAYFGGYVNENYRQLAQAVGLTREQVTLLARNSFEGSFLGEADKAARIAEVEAWAACSA